MCSIARDVSNFSINFLVRFRRTTTWKRSLWWKYDCPASGGSSGAATFSGRKVGAGWGGAVQHQAALQTPLPSQTARWEGFAAVLRIRDTLVWIRIRILLFSSLTFKIPTIKLFFIFYFSAYYFLKVHLHHFSEIKSRKESQNIRNQGFSYYCCMMIEGSGSGAIPLTIGSGSGMPKNMWIRWVRIRIRNTGLRITIRHFHKTGRIRFDLVRQTKEQGSVEVPNSNIVSYSNGSFLECSPPTLEARVWFLGQDMTV